MIKKKAFAKLNLNLHVIPQKNSNGYHSVRFINTQLALHDELLFEPSENKVEVVCDHKEMPRQENNLVYKAALLLQEMDPQKRGIKITIKKNIPIKAGLGGGSADAAVTIHTLCRLWNIRITERQQKSLADKLSNDVHYSLVGKVAEVNGNGDEIISLQLDVPKFWLVIVVPKETKSSTEKMYMQIDEMKIGQHLNFIPKIKEAMKTRNKDSFLNYIFNDFEDAAFKYFPITLTMKRDLENNGALKTLLCGSGLSMVGFFTDKVKANKAKKLLINKYKDVVISQAN
jgi:4-diphosphocytidyl-2-C-methyl-D-erythritol kinase